MFYLLYSTLLTLKICLTPCSLDSQNKDTLTLAYKQGPFIGHRTVKVIVQNTLHEIYKKKTRPKSGTGGTPRLKWIWVYGSSSRTQGDSVQRSKLKEGVFDANLKLRPKVGVCRSPKRFLIIIFLSENLYQVSNNKKGFFG